MAVFLCMAIRTTSGFFLHGFVHDKGPHFPHNNASFFRHDGWMGSKYQRLGEGKTVVARTRESKTEVRIDWGR